MAPVTRAQQQVRDRQAGSRQQDTATGGPSSVIPSIERDVPRSQTAPSAPSHLVRGRSGLQYSFQRLSPTSVPRATIGLNSAFEIERSRKCEDDDYREYQAIQLNQPVSIRILNPTHADGEMVVSCGCEEYRQEQRTQGTPVCVHIYVS